MRIVCDVDESRQHKVGQKDDKQESLHSERFISMKLKGRETSLWCSEVRLVITLGVLVGKGQAGALRVP